ncbi:hypothetical protein Poli38472_011633 [Pythium oligandrum]|uniref:NrS-1 polymerase-like helicase domain-containing protein n=1 Tax=Pythium oligandrum TaxID=41045 RepID=A0A8K1FNL4_PYTOL|nr:hypothetical protein Poli38472_011633 [Pythium oligandrum]|eukprot:TMW64753.1 hypothetical protein Poli38472_011633 [Pythium oligandrum]
MCNFKKSDGEQCKLAPKKDRCSKHPEVQVTEPVIGIEEVTTSVETAPVETTIVEEIPVEAEPSVVEDVVRKIPAASKMSNNTWAKCKEFLSNQNGTFHMERRMKKDSDEYCHKLERDCSIIRVEDTSLQSKHPERRRFFWIYNNATARDFAVFVGLQLRCEAHEIITQERIRFFFDIDLALDECARMHMLECFGFEDCEPDSFKDEEYLTTSFDACAKRLVEVYIRAVEISLEENGINIDQDLSMFDYMATSRNRFLDDGGYKISIHIMTNLFLTLPRCRALMSDIKENVIVNNTEVLGINDLVVDHIMDAIDCQQLRFRGSLSMPFSTKKGNTNIVIRDYSIPGQSWFINQMDQFCTHDLDMSKYNVVEARDDPMFETSHSFVAEALKHTSLIPCIGDFEINILSLKKSLMRPRRIRSSPTCPSCGRGHDNDNTLLLIFDENLGIAKWKCVRSKDRATVFYQHVADVDESDLEAFAKKELPAIKAEVDDLLEAEFNATFSSERVQQKLMELVKALSMTYVDFKNMICAPGYEYKTETPYWAEEKLSIKNQLKSDFSAKYQTFEHLLKSLTFQHVEIMSRFVMFFVNEFFIFTISDYKNGFLKTRYEFITKEIKSTRLFIPYRIESFQQITIQWVTKTETTKVVNGEEKSIVTEKMQTNKLGSILTTLPFHRFADIQYIWDHDPTNENVFSMAQPYVFEPRDGDVSEADLPESIMHYFIDVLCHGDMKQWEWLRSYLANIIHQPNERTGVCLVLYSKAKRLGKSTLYKLLSSLILGTHNCTMANSLSAIFGERGSPHTVGKKLVWFEELAESKAEFRSCIERFKAGVTDRTTSYRKLYQEYAETINTNEYIAATNNLIGVLEDRMTVFGVSAIHQEDQLFYAKMCGEFTPEVASKFCAYLKKYTTSLPMKPMKTELYYKMLENSQEHIQTYIDHIKTDSNSDLNPIHRPSRKGDYWFMRPQDMFNHYIVWCKNNNEKPVDQTSFKNKLQHFDPAITFAKLQITKDCKAEVYRFPPDYFPTTEDA